MNTVQLTSLARSCPTSYRYFRGVYALDTIPSLLCAPSTYICNLDTSDNPGTHWISMYVPPDDSPVEYFDPYGLDAPSRLEKNFLHPVYIFNQRSIQQPLSTVCGQYALYYIWQRPLHESMNKVLQIFDECYQYYNDCLVNSLVETHFDVDLDVINYG